MYDIKEASLDDIEKLTDLRIEFLREALEIDANNPLDELTESIRSYFQEKMSKGEFLSLLAIHNDEIIATSGISFYSLPPSNLNVSGQLAYIMNMYTKPKWRRKGIGTKLFQELIEIAKRKGIKVIKLHATDDGKRIYESFKFQYENNYMSLTLD